MVAGNSAAALLGAEWVDPNRPAELVTERKHPPPLIIVRNEALLAGETAVAAGVPVTCAARTAFDLGRRPGLTAAVMGMDALARATRLTADDVHPCSRHTRGFAG